MRGEHGPFTQDEEHMFESKTLQKITNCPINVATVELSLEVKKKLTNKQTSKFSLLQANSKLLCINFILSSLL